MSALDKCKNCGKLVSSEISSCIHCEAERCNICGQLDECSPSWKGSRPYTLVCRECSKELDLDESTLTYSYEWQCELCGHANKSSHWAPSELPYHPGSIIKNAHGGVNINKEYGFLTKKSRHNELFHLDKSKAPSGSWIGEQRKYPNGDLRKFLGDYPLPLPSCSTCGHKQRNNKFFCPASLRVYECAFCAQHGRLENMNALVRHHEDSFDKSQKYRNRTHCEHYDEVLLVHRSCLKYCKKYTSNSVSLKCHDGYYEIWSVEQVLKQANLIEKDIQVYSKKAELLNSNIFLPVWIVILVGAFYLWGWMGVLMSFILILIAYLI